MTATDSTLSSAPSQTETINPAEVDHFAVSTSLASPDMAGSIGTVTVTAVDVYNNPVSSGPSLYRGTVDLTSSDGHAMGLPAPYTFTTADAGTHTFVGVALATAGSQTFTATDATESHVQGTSTQVQVVPTAASQLAFVAPPPSLTAGAASGVITVQLEDEYGNPVERGQQRSGCQPELDIDRRCFSHPGSSTAITDVTIIAGSSTAGFTYADTVAASPKITAVSTGLSPATLTETVSPAKAVSFRISTSFDSPDQAGTTGTVTVTALDAFNNPVSSGPNLYLGSVDLASSDPQVAGLPDSYSFTAADIGAHSFTGVSLKTAGNQTFTAADTKDGDLVGTSSSINVIAATATQLVVTTPPPSEVTAGQSFTLVITAEDGFGNVDSSFEGDVTITLPDDPSFTSTVQAKDGIATFTGLTLGRTSSGGSIQATGGGLSPASAPPIVVHAVQTAPLPQAPTIVGEQAVMSRKTNKKGKPIGKPLLMGFVLQYSTAMNAQTAGSTANYSVSYATVKHIKKKSITTLKSVPFNASYDPIKHSVTLTISGKQKFAKGGEITVNYSTAGGVSSSDGVALPANDGMFTILPKASSVAPG